MKADIQPAEPVAGPDAVSATGTEARPSPHSNPYLIGVGLVRFELGGIRRCERTAHRGHQVTELFRNIAYDRGAAVIAPWRCSI